MEAREVGAAVLTDPVSIAYLTGFATNPHERLMALVMRDGGAQGPPEMSFYRKLNTPDQF